LGAERGGGPILNSERSHAEALGRGVFDVPESQCSVENERVFTRADVIVHVLLTVVNVSALAWGLTALLAGVGLREPRLWIAVTVLFPMLVMWELRWLSLPGMRRPRPLPAPVGARVAVITTFVPAVESLEMLERTLRALVALEYEHETWVLDEGDDPDVKSLCARAGARYFTRHGRPDYNTARGRFQTKTKHGNVNTWLHKVGFHDYEVVAMFDPDHIPRRDYLTRLLGYLRDPGVAFVQSPQLYYNQEASFIARGAAEETYAYYSSLQMTGYAGGFPVLVGCHTVHRTAALEQIGGLPAHEADDTAATLLYLAHGWRGVYDPVPLAAGLTPVDWHGYLRQQRRWARSILDLKLRWYPRLFRSLPGRVGVAAGLHGLYYFSGLAAPLVLTYLCYLLLSGQQPLSQGSSLLPLAVIGAVLTCCDFYRQRFYLRPRLEWGLHWRAMILKYAKWPWLVIALLDAVSASTNRFEVTAKKKVYVRRAVTVPHALVGLAIGSVWVVSLLTNRNPDALVQAFAAIAVLASAAIAATGFRRFPAPFGDYLSSRMTIEQQSPEPSQLSATKMHRLGS
jgi:cellulose synthase (UDP-forming)